MSQKIIHEEQLYSTGNLKHAVDKLNKISHHDPRGLDYGLLLWALSTPHTILANKTDQ